MSPKWMSRSLKLKKKSKEEQMRSYFPDSCQTSRNYGIKTNTSERRKSEDELLPMTGAEPDYDPHLWNTNSNAKYNHNCYAYFLDHLIPDRLKRPQMGHRDRTMEPFRTQDYTREELSRRAIFDNPNIYCTDPEEKCADGYYKGVLVVDRYNSYHWLRQDKNGYWSHKPGRLDVTNIDADGKLIKDPRTANLLYDKEDKEWSLLYSDVGPFFCVPGQDLRKSGKVKIESFTCDQCGGYEPQNKKKTKRPYTVKRRYTKKK